MSINTDLYRDLVDNLFDGVYFVDKNRKIVFWNQGAERLSGYPMSELVGTCCQDSLLRHEDAEGRELCKGLCPLDMTLRDGETREAQLFLHHKNGDRIPVLVKVAPMRDDKGQIIGAVEIFNDNSPQIALSRRIEELQRLTHLDALTGVSNRRFVEMSLSSKIAEMERYGWSFGLLFIDIDNFKHVNDRYGHAAGDGVLRMVAHKLRTGTRSYDTVGRWGGEEFVVILVNVNDFQLLTIAERVRTAVANAKMTRDQDSLGVKISIGATLIRPEDKVESAIARADGFMYTSKEGGGNRVTIG